MNTKNPALLTPLSAACKAMGDSVRLQLLYCLSHGELTVGDLVDRVNASQPSVSKHLSTLKQAGLICRRQQRNKAYYRLASTEVLVILESLGTLINNELIGRHTDSFAAVASTIKQETATNSESTPEVVRY